MFALVVWHWIYEKSRKVVICHIEVLTGLFGHLRIGNLEVLVFSLLCLVSVTLDWRKIPQSGDMSHRGLSGLFGHFRTGNLEVMLYLVFEKILQSGDISHLVWLYFWEQVADFRLGIHDWVGYCRFIVTSLLTSADLWQSVAAGYKFSVVINLRNLLKICSYFGCENKKYFCRNNEF